MNNPNNNDDKKAGVPTSTLYGDEATFVSPLLTAGAGVMFGLGIAFYESIAVPPRRSIPVSFYYLNGLAGGLLSLGAYSGVRTFYQDDERNTAFCVTGFGSAIGAAVGIGNELELYMKQMKQNKLPEPHNWRVVARGGLADGLVALSCYGFLKTLGPWGKYTAWESR